MNRPTTSSAWSGKDQAWRGPTAARAPGWTPYVRQIRFTVLWLRPVSAAMERVDQACLAPAAGSGCGRGRVPRCRRRPWGAGAGLFVQAVQPFGEEAGAPLAEGGRAADDKIRRIYLDDLDQVLPGFADHVVEAEVQRWPTGAPYCFPGRGRLQQTLTRRSGRVLLAGDYLGTLCTETAIQSGLSAAQEALSLLATDRQNARHGLAPAGAAR
ncbi:FAD-dependent oxidoreductase [Streptomyces curacoi]|nr:FAD-dependent oxidoreductase [Streptomyces curacoi]